MNSRQYKIIEKLNEKGQWITGKELALMLNVSDRTIRNDIEVINKEYPGLIFSNVRNGYCVKKDILMQANIIRKNDIPQTATYVIRPNMAIALCGFDSANNDIALNDGVIVGYYDKQMLPSKRLLADVVENIKPKAYFGFTGNDGSFIHKTLAGTPCVSMGMSVTNMGSANEMVAKNDVNMLIDSLYNYLHHLNEDIIVHCGFGDDND